MVSVLAWLVIIAGIIVYFVGFIATLRELYDESLLLCGLGFLVPLVAWIYALMHFKEMKSEFWCLTVGSVLAWTGIAILKLGTA